jgi:ketol-acid reductoisomerase
MHRFISETAQYGDLTRGPYVVDEHTRTQMKRVLSEIQDGRFAREWIAEYRAGNPNYRALKQADLEHPIEAVGRKLRAGMPWLNPRGEAPANPSATAASTSTTPQATPAEAGA